MKFVFASDSFKGSLSGKEANRMLERAAKEVFGEVECISLPVADGGEGTADALIEATDGERIYAEVHDPCMQPISAYYGKLKKEGKFNTLPTELKEIAVLRLENPDMSLKQIGEALNPPLSRSGVNHRLQKIIDLAE